LSPWLRAWLFQRHKLLLRNGEVSAQIRRYFFFALFVLFPQDVQRCRETGKKTISAEVLFSVVLFRQILKGFRGSSSRYRDVFFKSLEVMYYLLLARMILGSCRMEGTR